MNGSTHGKPIQYFGSLSDEAKLLLKWCPIDWCMSFIYNTGYIACTEHCCNNNDDETRSPETLFIPHFNPSALPAKRVNASTKLIQWFIPDSTRAPKTDDTKDVVILEDVDEPLSDFWAAKMLDDHRGKDVSDIIDMDLSTLPPAQLHQVMALRNEYLRHRMNQTRHPAVADRTGHLTEKRNFTRHFMEKYVLFSLPLAWLADTAFWSRPAKGFDELSKAYLAWRKIWFTFVFRQGAEPISPRLELLESSIQHILPILNLWGDVRNDYNLYHYGELTRRDLRYTYEQEPDALHYLLANNSIWKEECLILDNYVGLRREMNRDHFHLAKRAAQRAGTAMDNLLQAEANMKADKDKSKESANKFARQKMLYIAKSRFLEIEAAYLGHPIPGGPETQQTPNP
ncbi:hypothetical protein EDB81DRAFT_909062 [Dactylonectria macrodidyma]|uniref:Uncharacterized protein n=1 Tax=Dactylonectria macrodidyma TaxID=307937 RepID=A0A9P9FQF2_9HYPO|nr:hypothetical protein EDB81DRAFT_909062 [Dactylonectria macrodidyma]